MAEIFDQKQIGLLRKGYGQVAEKYNALLGAYTSRRYIRVKADEYAKHGFARRLAILRRCVDRVFEVLPPDRTDIPSQAEVLDATVNIQAFMFNVFGCLDNLAWVWVSEMDLTRENGTPLSRSDVGLGERCKAVRASFSEDFRAYLESRKSWFEHIVDFRDALAHRIPLFIPPYIVDPAVAERHVAIESEKFTALFARDFNTFRQLQAEQDAHKRFQPIMLHSLVEGSRPVIFHLQLLNDFDTVDEMAREMLAELDRANVRRSARID